ncbi:hypothetical protein JCM16814_09230 [Desulfobaculum senezii]|jgi:hypothetical protein
MGKIARILCIALVLGAAYAGVNVYLHPSSAPEQRWYVRQSVSHTVINPDSLFSIPSPDDAAQPARNGATFTPRHQPGASAPEHAATASTIPGGAITDASIITGINFTESGSRLDVHIASRGASPRFSAFALDNPARIVVDLFAQSELPPAMKELPVSSTHATRIRTGVHPGRSVVRTVIDTTPDQLAHYDVHACEHGIRVRLGS